MNRPNTAPARTGGRGPRAGSVVPVFALAALAALAVPAGPGAAQQLTSPEEEFGHVLGADYHLTNYTQLQRYWEKLSRQSDRMVLDTIGFTEEGRPQLMAILTSPENHRNLDRYREISRRLAQARGVTEEEARALAREGKAVVWIDGGLHATETLGAQQLMEFVWRMVRYDDPETLRFLDDAIVLAVHANPDGMELVSDWYMRLPDPEDRTSVRDIPVLYQKYAGHDNNRDFYASNLAETTNMNRVMAREWFPQIVYNHHQRGPQGTIMFAPPFRDPPNHFLDPLVITSLDQVGSAMHGRFVQEGKGGTTMRSGASYSTWWNGGLRTTPYFRNQIGLLTETRGEPWPTEIPFLADRQLPKGDIPLPREPGPFHMREAIEYSQTANWAVLDYATRYKDQLLFNAWRMGMNSIERGSRDHWTPLPKEIDRVDRAGNDRWEEILRDPAARDPRAYILSSSQADFPTATRFVNALLKNGVEVHVATEPFRVGAASYPQGSYVVRADQAFRPMVLDMFEPQNHPNDFAYPGGPPIAPYDNAGWTLALQMGVDFDRILEGIDGPFALLEDTLAPPPARVANAGTAAGFVLERTVNNAAVAVNRLLAAGHEVVWMTEAFRDGDLRFPAGTWYVPAAPGVREILEGAARERGVPALGLDRAPEGRGMRVEPIRIGLWDRWGGSMPSGWTRMILEWFEFPYTLVFPGELDRGDLAGRYDVLLFEDGAVPFRDGGGGDPGPERTEGVPDSLLARTGRVTVRRTVPEILEFMEEGGTVVAIGSSTSLAYHAGLPVTDHLVDEDGNSLRNDEYYVPGSVLKMRVDPSQPLAHGLDREVNVLFSRSPVFRMEPSAAEVDRVGWWDDPEPLISGWAWGQEKLQGGTGVMSASVGRGRLLLFGPKITFRAQSHGTFPFLFNGIYLGGAGEEQPIG